MCDFSVAYSQGVVGENQGDDDDESDGEVNNRDEEVRVEAEQPNREEFRGDAETSDEESVIVDIPRETEHLIISKYCVDGKELCGQCATHYCRQHGRDKVDSHYSHDVVQCAAVRAIYDVHKCDICSIGLIRVLGRSNCPTCYCNACNALNFPEKCAECKRSRVKFFHSVKEWTVEF